MAIHVPTRLAKRHLQGTPTTDTEVEIINTNEFAVKPIMATFFESVEGRGCCGMSREGHEKLLHAWDKSWKAMGWETKILTKKDAMKHPDFELLNEKLKKVHVTPYNHRCLWRWLAMAMNEDEHGGWMSDYDVFPLTLTGEVGLELAEKPGFQTWSGHVPALIHSDRESWDKIIHMMMDIIPEEHTSGTAIVTDMRLLMILHEHHKKAEMNVTTWAYNVAGGFPYYPPNEEHDEPVINCALAKMAFAAHLSHYDVKEAMRRRNNYPKIAGMKKLEYTERRGEAAIILMDDFREYCHD